jgi:DNA-binding CsgD family transcriptional regulator
MTATRDDLIATVQAVHAAGLDAARWPAALAAIGRLTGSVGATLEVVDRSTMHHSACLTVGIPPVRELEYVDHYARLNPRLPLHATAGTNELIWDYRVLGEPELRRDPFYAFLRRCGLRYFVSAVIRSDADSLADGMLVVAHDGTVVFANRAAQEMGRLGDGLRLGRRLIELADPDARACLAHAVAAAARLHEGESRRTASCDFQAPRPSGAPAYLVSVRPLADRERRLPGAGAAALVFVRDPARRDPAAASSLRDMFGLTAAEARLAQALQAGMTPGEHADARGLSLNTVYTHLRRLREKTGCASMPELIRKLDDLQPPIRPK